MNDSRNGNAGQTLAAAPLLGINCMVKEQDVMRVNSHVHRTGCADVTINLRDSSLGDKEISGRLALAQPSELCKPTPIPDLPKDSMLPLCESLAVLCRNQSVRFDIRISCDVVPWPNDQALPGLPDSAAPATKKGNKL